VGLAWVGLELGLELGLEGGGVAVGVAELDGRDLAGGRAEEVAGVEDDVGDGCGLSSCGNGGGWDSS